MASIWWRIKTLDFGTNAHGYMKMSLFTNYDVTPITGWTMLELGNLRLTQLYEYDVPSSFTRD